MNKGGTSSLSLDFNPRPEGTSGQVVRFLHDPDSFKVIAWDFDEYLQMLIDGGYSFFVPEE
jgi:cell wall assembly regulator SMI1